MHRPTYAQNLFFCGIIAPNLYSLNLNGKLGVYQFIVKHKLYLQITFHQYVTLSRVYILFK